jgi:hypothetical protein
VAQRENTVAMCRSVLFLADKIFSENDVAFGPRTPSVFNLAPRDEGE